MIHRRAEGSDRVRAAQGDKRESVCTPFSDNAGFSVNDTAGLETLDRCARSGSLGDRANGPIHHFEVKDGRIVTDTDGDPVVSEETSVASAHQRAEERRQRDINGPPFQCE